MCSSKWALASLILLLLPACGSEPGEPPVPVPVRLEVSAPDTALAVGGTLQYAVVALDSAGEPVPVDSVAWHVTWTVPGTIDRQGLFTAKGVGHTWVGARLASPPLADSLPVQVLAPGTVRWRWDVREVGAATSRLGGVALGADGTIYTVVVLSDFPEAAKLAALDRSGQPRWVAELGPASNNHPVVTPGGDILVVGQRIQLFRPDGTVRWDEATDADAADLNTGAATAEVAVAAYGQRVRVLRLTDGSTLWQTAFYELAELLVPPTILRNDLIYAKKNDDTLFAFRFGDGAILRTFLDPDTGLVYGRGPVPVAGRVYLPTFNRYAAFDTAGSLLWLTEASGAGSPEPAVGPGGMLYVQGRRFGLEALDPDGNTVWYRRHLSTRGGWSEQPRWPWYGGAALARGGIIYAAGNDSFWAYSVSGDSLWRYIADSAGVVQQAFTGAPAIGPDGTVYTYTSTHVYAFFGPSPPEPDSPWPMWRHDAQRTGWAR